MFLYLGGCTTCALLVPAINLYYIFTKNSASEPWFYTCVTTSMLELLFCTQNLVFWLYCEWCMTPVFSTKHARLIYKTLAYCVVSFGVVNAVFSILFLTIKVSESVLFFVFVRFMFSTLLVSLSVSSHSRIKILNELQIRAQLPFITRTSANQIQDEANSPQSQRNTTKSIFHALSDQLFDIREKLTDEEYKNLSERLLQAYNEV
jgi:hypothetical protein